MKKRFLSLLIIVSLILSLIPHITLQASASVFSGSCGEAAFWSFDDSSGILTISGGGEMTNYTTTERSPWYDYRESITKIQIEGGISSIGDYAFEGCSSIQTVTIPEGVITVGKNAFDGCILNSIYLPSTLTNVRPYSFTNAKEVHIPSMGDWLHIRWEGSYDFGDYYCVSNPLRYGCTIYVNNAPISDFIIPEGVTAIPQFAFYGCTTINSITLPDSIVTIGGRAFEGCSSVKSFFINNLEAFCRIKLEENRIGMNAFDGGKGAAPMQNGADLFLNGSLLTKLNLPEGIGSISSYLFSGCTSISEVNFPTSEITVGNYVFINCTNLANTAIPSYMTEIPEGIFSGCISLKDIVIPDGVTSIGSYAFARCTLDRVSFPQSLTSVGASAFSGSTKNVFIPSIEDWLEITWGGTFDWGDYFCASNPIRGNAVLFINNIPTSDIVIPDGITDIHQFAFYANSNIRSVTIPSSVTTIGGRAFLSCENLNAVIINDLEAFCKIDLLENQIAIIAFDEGKGAAPLRYGADLFLGSQKITAMTIPAGCTSIDGYLFYGCTSLNDVTIPMQVDSIGQHAFDNCSNLETIKFFNPLCIIGESSIPRKTTIYGLLGSTAETYAKNHGNKFVPLISSEISWNKSSIYFLNGNLPVTVYGNNRNPSDISEKYTLLKDATVTYDSNTFDTDKDGFVKFKYEGGSVTVSKSDYVSRTISENAIRKCQTIYLQKESDSPVICGLWMNDQDILHENASVSLIGKEQYTLIPEISWGKDQLASVFLSQGSTSVQIINGSITLAWSDYFDVSQPIYLVAKNASGLTSRKQLKLSVESKLPESLSNLKIEFGDSLSIKLPDSVPEFFQGTEVSAGIYSNIPIEYTIENGKIFAAIGFQKDYSSSNGKIKAKTFVQSLKDVLKDAKDGIDDYKLYQAAQRAVGGYASVVEGSFGFKTGFKIMGYAEGYLTPEGTVVWLDSGMIMGGNVSVGYSLPFYLGPVPMFFEAKLAGSVEARVNLYIAPEAKKFTPNTELSGEVSLSAGLGVGIKDVASVSGGLKGSINPRWDISFGKTDYFQLKAKLKAYAKVALLFFEYSKDWNLTESVWYEYPEKKALRLGATLSEAFTPYAVDYYKMQDLSYLENGSVFSANHRKTRSAEQSDWLSNSYSNANPQLASFSDGTMLAVWIGMDETGTANGLRLFASFFDGYTWSEPKQIDPDNSMDAAPSLTVIDDVAYLTWQNASGDVSEVDSLDTLASMMDISYAVFEKEKQSFNIERITEDNGKMDVAPMVCGDGNSIYVVWERNTDNNWFGAENNSIVYRCYHNGAWEKEIAAFEDLPFVLSFHADFNEEAMIVAYIVDTDGDLNTTGDLEVYMGSERLTENGFVDSGAQFFNHSLYWYQNGNIVTQESSVIDSIPTDQFQIVSDSECQAILYVEHDGLFSTLYASYFDYTSGKWGDPIALTDGSTNISSFSATVSSGELCVLWTSEDIIKDDAEESHYGSTNLRFIRKKPTCDLAIDDILYDCSDFVDGADLTLDVTVHNNGEIAANGIIMTVSDSDGVELNTLTYGDVILSGATSVISCGFRADRSLYGKTVRITITPLNTEDSYPSNNSINTELSFQDIAVENMSFGVRESGETVVFADIVNRSYDDNNSAIIVTIHKDNLETEPLESITITGLDSLDVKRVPFTFDAQEGDIFFVAIHVDSGNEKRSNDSDFIVIPVTSHIHNYSTQIVAPTCTDQGYTLHTCSDCGDSYQDNEVAALGHAWDNGKVTKQPTETQNGIKTYTCARCGKTRTEVIPATSHVHNYDVQIIAPTCTDQGYTLHTCSGCGDSYKDSYTAPLEHNYVDGVCTRCGAKDPNATPIGPSPSFTDVKADAYYANPVAWAVENKITNGTSSSTFSPDATCTRGQVVTFLWRANGSPEPTRTDNPFTDVKPDAYYYKAVLWAVENGITSGTSKTTFSPDSGCTRGQVVTFQWRANGQPEPKTGTNPFTDVKSDTYYYKAVLWAVENGITNGTSQDKFSPDKTCTRGQIVTFLYRDMV